MRATRSGGPAPHQIKGTVENLEEPLARAEELGGRRLMGPTPVGKEGSFALFNVPDGNMSGLFDEC